MTPAEMVGLGCAAIAAIVMLRLLGAMSLPAAILIIVAVVWMYAPPASAATGTDFQCGPYRVTLHQLAGEELYARVNGDEARYTGTMLDESDNYVHQFGPWPYAELRVTTHGRVAFRKVNASRWTACQVLVLHSDQFDN